MIDCHSVAKCRFEAQQRYASTVTPIINSQFSILNFPFKKPHPKRHRGKTTGNTINISVI